MIDLLPTKVKKDRMYGRKNSRLLRWNIVLSLSIVGILIIGATGYFFVNNASISAAETNERTAELINSSDLNRAEKDYETFSSNLKTVIQILSNQVLFSELLQQIGSVTPAGATLNSVSLSDADNALDLDFTTTSSSVAPTIQVNLEDPENELFEKADVIQVTCTTGVDGDEDCNVQLRALFRTDAKFLFLNSVKSTGGNQ